MPPAIAETDSLASFTSDPQRYLDRLRQSGLPILLTSEGEAGIVVQDAASYQQILEKVEELETIAAVKEGLRDAAEGRTRPAREVLAEMAAKHRLPSVQDD